MSNNNAINFLLDNQLDEKNIFERPKNNFKKGRMISVYIKGEPLSILEKITKQNPSLTNSEIFSSLLLDVKHRI